MGLTGWLLLLAFLWLNGMILGLSLAAISKDNAPIYPQDDEK